MYRVGPCCCDVCVPFRLNCSYISRTIPRGLPAELEFKEGARDCDIAQLEVKDFFGNRDTSGYIVELDKCTGEGKIFRMGGPLTVPGYWADLCATTLRFFYVDGCPDSPFHESDGLDSPFTGVAYAVRPYSGGFFGGTIYQYSKVTFDDGLEVSFEPAFDDSGGSECDGEDPVDLEFPEQPEPEKIEVASFQIDFVDEPVDPELVMSLEPTGAKCKFSYNFSVIPDSNSDTYLMSTPCDPEIGWTAYTADSTGTAFFSDDGNCGVEQIPDPSGGGTGGDGTGGDGTGGDGTGGGGTGGGGTGGDGTGGDGTGGDGTGGDGTGGGGTGGDTQPYDPGGAAAGDTVWLFD